MSVSSFIFTYLKNKLPSINWNIGSTIRELIATPVVTLAEGANEALNTQANAVSIKALISNPEEYKDTIDQLYYSLDLNDNKSATSTGTITIFTKSDKPSTVFSNTIMYQGNQSVVVQTDTTPMLNPDGTAGAVQLRKLGYNSYAFEVPVVSLSNNTFLPLNTEMTWDEAPSDIYAITVSAAISGGRTEMTTVEKLAKIQDYLAPDVLSLSDGIAKILRNSLSDIVVDACYVRNTDTALTNYADMVNVNGLNQAYLYVKPLKAPGYEYIDVWGTKKEDGTYNISTKIVGIIELLSVYKGEEVIPQRQIQINNNDIYCNVVYKGEDTELFTLKVYRISDADTIQEFIDGYTAGSPFHIEIKAPTIFDLTIDFRYSGQELTAQDYATICTAIQEMPLNTPVTDTTLSYILSSCSAHLEGTGAYTICTHQGCCYKQQYSTTLYYTSDVSGYAVYLGASNIHAKYI